MRSAYRTPVDSGKMDHVAQCANEMRDALAAIRDIAEGSATAESLLRIARIALNGLPPDRDQAEAGPAMHGASGAAQLLYRAWESPGLK